MERWRPKIHTLGGRRFVLSITHKFIASQPQHIVVFMAGTRCFSVFYRGMANPKPSASQGDHKMWAHHEFASFKTGDQRLKKRLVQMTEDFVAAPQANIPQASGSWP